MATDPAWFYSTLAQSSAAIVGLIGGILGSRMLTHLQQLVESKRSLFLEVAEMQRQFAERRRDIEVVRAAWEFARRSAANIAADYPVARYGVNPAVKLPGGWIPPEAEIVRAVEDTPAFLREADATLKVLTELEQLYVEPTGTVDAISSRDTARRLRQAMVSPRVTKPQIHEDDAGRLDLVADRVERYRQTLIPQSFPWILAILAWIMVTGVVAPLIFLPAFPDGWSKVTLLATFTVATLGLMAAFWVQLAQLRGLGNLRWRTPREYIP